MNQASFGNNSKGGLETLFEGTAFEEFKLFETSMDEAKKILDDHNIAYKMEDDNIIATTILDEMLGYGCYYQLGFASDSEEEEPFFVKGIVRVFFRDDQEYREGVGKIKDCFQESVLKGYEMKQYKDLISYSHFTDFGEVVNLYWCPLKIITEDFLKMLPEDALEAEPEEILKKMKEEKMDDLEVVEGVEMATVHIEHDQDNENELIPEGFLPDMVCFVLRMGMAGEYDIIREGPALKEEQEQMFQKQYEESMAASEKSDGSDGTADDDTGEEVVNDDVDDARVEDDADDGAVKENGELDEEWKAKYLAYLDGLGEEIFDYQIEDINYDGIPEIIIWHSTSLLSSTFQYINKNGEVKESAIGTVYYNEDYVYCEGGIGNINHIDIYQYNESTGDFDAVCSASSGFWEESGASYTIDGVECSEEEYISRIESYKQGDFEIVYGEKEQGRGEITLQEAIKNY